MELKLLEGNAARLADRILQEAVASRASDIHIEALERETRVRLRIDGLLRELFFLPLSRHSSLISRFKIMAGMDIGEQRLPQDGRWQLQLEDRKLDLRLSTMPGIYGEKLAIRLMDASKQLLSLDQLDFSAVNRKLYQELYSQPNGLVLVTGPTGSGKSTTLYATLALLNKGNINITTLEDPVEYSLAGVNQVNLNEKAGLTFAKGLKAMVRQDPDIIMVGEIRDRETAEMAIQAALTGHLVFSTLHTNSAIGTIHRLLDMGIAPFLLAAALRGVLSQRLVRRICPHCKAKRAINLLERGWLGEKLARNIAEITYGSGCLYCGGTGYYGRIALQEIFTLDDHIARLLFKEIRGDLLKQEGERIGMVPMEQDALHKVLQGETTVEELLREGIIGGIRNAV